MLCQVEAGLFGVFQVEIRIHAWHISHPPVECNLLQFNERDPRPTFVMAAQSLALDGRMLIQNLVNYFFDHTRALAMDDLE